MREIKLNKGLIERIINIDFRINILNHLVRMKFILIVKLYGHRNKLLHLNKTLFLKIRD